MKTFGRSITPSQMNLARMFERAGLTTISQAVKAFERRNDSQIEEWKRQLAAKSAVKQAEDIVNEQ